MQDHNLRLELYRGTEPEMVVVWDMLKEGYAKRYRGWSGVFDGRYSKQSVWGLSGRTGAGVQSTGDAQPGPYAFVLYIG